MVAKYKKESDDMHAMLYQEDQSKQKLQMELESRDAELELLHQRLVALSETGSVESMAVDSADAQNGNNESSGENCFAIFLII